jgi:hypothetical protein
MSDHPASGGLLPGCCSRARRRSRR